MNDHDGNNEWLLSNNIKCIYMYIYIYINHGMDTFELHFKLLLRPVYC